MFKDNRLKDVKVNQMSLDCTNKEIEPLFEDDI
jgi:hypothetical protein